MPKLRDPFCKAIYAWEDSWPEWDTETLTLAECRKLAHYACRAYGLHRPAVRQHKYGMAFSISYTPPDGSFISFVRKHKNKAIVLHEVAHSITDRLFGSRCQNHGWKWQGVYFFLLSKANIAPKVALKASLRPFGLRWHEVRPR